VDYDAAGHLLIIYSALIKYLRIKGEYKEAVNRLFIGFKKAYDSVRRKVLYNILIEVCILMKLVRLIKMCLTGTCSRVNIDKILSGIFHIRNGLKQGNTLLSLVFRFALGYAIKSVQVNQDGLKLNGTLQFLVYADDVKIFGGSVHSVKEKAATLMVASKEIGLEVNAGINMYMVMYREQNAGQVHSMKIDNCSFERVQDFKYLRTTLVN
jgi:hypothetical protein